MVHIIAKAPDFAPGVSDQTALSIITDCGSYRINHLVSHGVSPSVSHSINSHSVNQRVGNSVNNPLKHRLNWRLNVLTSTLGRSANEDRRESIAVLITCPQGNEPTTTTQSHPVCHNQPQIEASLEHGHNRRSSMRLSRASSKLDPNPYTDSRVNAIAWVRSILVLRNRCFKTDEIAYLGQRSLETRDGNSLHQQADHSPSRYLP